MDSQGDGAAILVAAPQGASALGAQPGRGHPVDGLEPLGNPDRLGLLGFLGAFQAGGQHPVKGKGHRNGPQTQNQVDEQAAQNRAKGHRAPSGVLRATSWAFSFLTTRTNPGLRATSPPGGIRSAAEPVLSFIGHLALEHPLLHQREHQNNGEHHHRDGAGIGEIRVAEALVVQV